jgi:GLPGLI family protein
MRTLKLIGLLYCCAFVHTGFAQKNYVEAGTIEYERKTNIHKLNQDNEWFSRMKDQVAKFHTAYYELTFTPEIAHFKPGKEVENKVGWFAPPAIANQVFTNFKTGEVTSSKVLFEDTYLIKDSLRNTKWKITNEYRNILGYECRKAVGKICDSVVVVAFYCDQISTSIGPEGFGGLPGGILGLAIPRMWTTWFATKITPARPSDPVLFEQPKKGKETTNEKIQADLRSALKDWGDYVNIIMWFVVI